MAVMSKLRFCDGGTITAARIGAKLPLFLVGSQSLSLNYYPAILNLDDEIFRAEIFQPEPRVRSCNFLRKITAVGRRNMRADFPNCEAV
jgi:hypothetical protein